MNAWIIRPYPHYKYRMNEFLTGNMVAVGWPRLPNLASVSDEALIRLLDKHYSNSSSGWRRHARSTVNLFRWKVELGDYVVATPRMGDSESVAIGTVQGSYRFVNSCATDETGYPHQRRVRWLATDVKRGKLPDAVTRSMKQGTLNRTDADALHAFCRRYAQR